ncbi:unnamed protein product [Gadus morhua 'NCC']
MPQTRALGAVSGSQGTPCGFQRKKMASSQCSSKNNAAVVRYGLPLGSAALLKPPSPGSNVGEGVPVLLAVVGVWVLP